MPMLQSELKKLLRSKDFLSFNTSIFLFATFEIHSSHVY